MSRSAQLYELRLIGAFQLRRATTLVHIRHSEQRVVALAAVLGPMTRTEAASRLWPDAPALKAAACLRTALSRLRGTCDGLITSSADVLAVDASDVDLWSARTWAHLALSSDPSPLPGGPPHLPGRDLLAGWDEDWLLEAREELRLLEICALEAVAARLTNHNRLGLAASMARAATRLDPLRESASRALIEVYMREGNTAAALGEYHRIRSSIEKELGTSLSLGLTSLVAGLAHPTLTDRR